MIGSHPAGSLFVNDNSSLVALDPTAIASTGGGQPHATMQPYLTVNCIVKVAH